MVARGAVIATESPFRGVLKRFSAECETSAKEIPAFNLCKPFSPNAYNAISLPILNALCDCLWEIDHLSDLPFYSNLGLILFCDLQVAASRHYFLEYERIQGFQDPKPAAGLKVIRPKARLGSRIVKKLTGLAQAELSKVTSRGKVRVGYLGPTTFSWQNLRKELRTSRVSLVQVVPSTVLQIPRLDEQLEALSAWGQKIYRVFCDDMGSNNADLFDPVAFITHWLQKQGGLAMPGNENCDVLVTGSMSPQQRAFSLASQAKGIPLILVHHGAQYLIFDEPFYGLYEGALPDAKIVYGHVAELAKENSLANTTNLAGHSIKFVGRTDPLLKTISSNTDSIAPCQHLRGKKVLYLASEFSSGRYGPHRDVHPGTYCAWQEQLLAWVKKQTGLSPLMRLHPKRPSTKYDPSGYEQAGGDMQQALEWADVFLIDYPTTSLAYVSATRKPVLFFDLGLRRLHPKALDCIKSRCHYAKADVLDPEAGFDAMASDFGRICHDNYTSLFCRSDDTRDEASVAADTILDVLRAR